MEDAAATLAEETFAFPKYAALFEQAKSHAFVLGLVKQLHATKVVPVRMEPVHFSQNVVYEYVVEASPIEAVFVRSAWLRPVGSMDGAGPLRIQIVVDGEVTLDQSIDEHLRTGYPFPRRACSCNRWEATLGCKCQVPALVVGSTMKIYPAIERDEQGQAWPERRCGVFAPNKTVVQVVVVKPGDGPVEFQARCGITAALYSTRTQDMAK